jgi:hypothetical protein
MVAICDWCCVKRDDLKKVKINKYTDDAMQGIRHLCARCRAALEGEYILLEKG